MDYYVVWSGGCDSTYLLKLWSGVACKDKPVYAVSFEHFSLNEMKMKCERRARKRILAKLNNPFLKHMTIRVEWGGEFPRGPSKQLGATQACILLGLMLPYLNDGESAIAFGYVRGDDFWHDRDHVQQVLDGLTKLCGVNAKVEYPIEYKRKTEIITELKDGGLFELCWTCENPAKFMVPCGECVPCQTQRMALMYLEDEKRREKIKNATKEKKCR